MKPLTWLLLVPLVCPAVGASPSGEEFVIDEIKDITEIRELSETEITETEFTETKITETKITESTITETEIWESESRESESTVVVPIKPLPLPPPKPVASPTPKSSKLIRVVQGAASWYGPGFYGRTTASGERLRKGTMTAAHRTLPFGTRVRVTNLSNGRSVVVRINDRGPFKYHRVIDLAHGAASQLRMMQAGEVPVKLEILKPSP